MKVVATGSLEDISQPPTKGLVQKGHAVTVIGSKPEKQEDMEALGATAHLGPASVTGVPMPGQAGRVAGWGGRELDLAREELRAKDPVMRGLIDANPNLDPDAWRAAQPVEGLFEALLFQIVGQQISVSALNVIYARLRARFPGGHPDPAILAKIPVDALRRIGLSTRKAEYARDLARRAAEGELNGLADLPHEEARNRLVSFRGIGPWTADGALLMTFGWPDVLVSGDLTMRKAVQRTYGLSELPSEKEVEAIGERWRPHRSLAAAYLFDSLGLA
ncbi:MAG: DNA-3-methyladenine glycosylase 2 family protein [Ferruginibacter sp.]|nr:DNA-3-methyladenine glycosylase 2 family protein [Cytophagales bacterium]